MWSCQNHSISKVAVEQRDSVELRRVTSVAVSLCGNFGVLGYESGHIQKFNLQSGIDRGFFALLHEGEVTSLAIDALNHYLTSASLDQSLRMWDFNKRNLVHEAKFDHSIENLCYNRGNDLVAVYLGDLSIEVRNAKNGLKRVRRFESVADNRITDLCFSQPDSKWLLASSLDKSLRVFDILTGSLIDWLRFEQAPLAIDFALSGEFLATSHVGSKAVYLWSNKNHF